MGATVNNYARALEQARRLFLTWDQENMIRCCALRADADFLYLRFLGQPMRICRATGVMEYCAQGRPAGFEESLSAYDYLCRSAPLPGMQAQLRPASALRHAAQSSPSEVRLYQRYADDFQARIPLLRRALERLGYAPFAQGDVACRFEVFDGFSAVFQFWEGDEEFPPSVRFLWCENALDFLKFETLYYVMHCFFQMLTHIMEEIEKNG